MRRELALLCIALAACTDVSLYQAGTQPNLANKISLVGDICTDDPSAVAPDAICVMATGAIWD